MRYKKATKKEKTKILDELCATIKSSRKHTIKLLNRSSSQSNCQIGRRKLYGMKEAYHLMKVWKLTRGLCSKRLKEALPLWLEYYEAPGFDDRCKALLLQMSPSTIDRLLIPYRKRFGLSATKSSAYLKQMIPIELLHSQVKSPGALEADTVAHCGDSLAGKFINTLTITDLYSGWTSNRACWGKDAKEVLEQIKDIRKKLPFIVRSFACDNGTEFINKQLQAYLQSSPKRPVHFVRRRPYKKNDAAHVEQKNDTHVRQLFGYERIEHIELQTLMNEIYEELWNPLNNYFYPTLKLVKKHRVGAKTKKIYDRPKTPYQRLLDSKSLSSLKEEQLRINRKQCNPIEMARKLEEKLAFFKKKLKRYGAFMEEPESA